MDNATRLALLARRRIAKGTGYRTLESRKLFGLEKIRALNRMRREMQDVPEG